MRTRAAPTRTVLAAGLAAALAAGACAGADPERGRMRYDDLCGRCHGNVTERTARAPGRLLPVVVLPLGPNLTGIYGREAGAVAGYRYSNAFRATIAGLVWDDETLNRWLTDSQKMARGSYMYVKVPEPDRGDVIAYLRAYARY